ncbi:cuticle protein AM/CP1114-like [Palaemon carinicauda]|uniref:cuticle protein AM/CP1114-like n=1 Tax=Palaemon carinicauda TaxID=392227 RepID=UPI0035B691C4
MRLIIFSCLVAASLAASKPQGDTATLRDDRVDQGHGNFNYSSYISDDSSVKVAGSLGEGGAVNLSGKCSTFRDGGWYFLDFEADEAGFRVWPSAVHSVVFYREDADVKETDLR